MYNITAKLSKDIFVVEIKSKVWLKGCLQTGGKNSDGGKIEIHRLSGSKVILRAGRFIFIKFVHTK